MLGLAAPAAAQSKGHSYGHYKHPAPPPQGGGSDSAAPAVTATGARVFGAWLDDASLMEPGDGMLSVSFGWFKSPVFREFDAPVFDGGVGVMRRVQFGVSVPYYHVSEPGGPVTRGLGDFLLSAKIQVRDPTAHAVGFAVTPVLEVLSSEPGPDVPRINWALPVSAEYRQPRWRAFGSAGYFSRGSVFGAGALEVAVTDRAWVTGTITRSYSTLAEDVGARFGLGPSRTDASGGVTFSVSPALTVFGSIGRTISKQDVDSASLVVSAGASFGFLAWKPYR
ncbi:MAG: hypothetical protein LC804_17675 [Acidobacteria bacterium]|nr:hypothetical protein [Acidobacteriota bacterium]